MDVEPPFALVSVYRTGRGTQKAVAGVGGGTKEKDEKEKTQLVLSCRKLLNEARTFFQQKIDSKS